MGSMRAIQGYFIGLDEWRRGWDSSQVAASAADARCAMPYKPARADNDRAEGEDGQENTGIRAESDERSELLEA